MYIYRHNYNYNTIVGGGEVRALNAFVGIGNKKNKKSFDRVIRLF